MNLTQDKFHNNLMIIIEELRNVDHNKEDAYFQYVSDRLNQSLVAYNNDLDSMIKQLNTYKPEKLLKYMRD